MPYWASRRKSLAIPVFTIVAANSTELGVTPTSLALAPLPLPPPATPPPPDTSLDVSPEAIVPPPSVVLWSPEPSEASPLLPTFDLRPDPLAAALVALPPLVRVKLESRQMAMTMIAATQAPSDPDRPAGLAFMVR